MNGVSMKADPRRADATSWGIGDQGWGGEKTTKEGPGRKEKEWLSSEGAHKGGGSTSEGECLREGRRTGRCLLSGWTGQDYHNKNKYAGSINARGNNNTAGAELAVGNFFYFSIIFWR